MYHVLTNSASLFGKDALNNQECTESIGAAIFFQQIPIAHAHLEPAKHNAVALQLMWAVDKKGSIIWHVISAGAKIFCVDHMPSFQSLRTGGGGTRGGVGTLGGGGGGDGWIARATPRTHTLAL